MDKSAILMGKKILIVDDERDVLESLIELLGMCKIDTASTFKDAIRLPEGQSYEIVVLDIMGVEGFKLLDTATDKNIPAIMLTAHALSEENLKKSAREGAAYFAPKEKMIDIGIYIADVLIALEKKKSTWSKWFERLGHYYDSRFQGTNWREDEKEFWRKKLKARF